MGKKPARRLDWLGQLRLKKQQQQQEAARLRVADRGTVPDDRLLSGQFRPGAASGRWCQLTSWVSEHADGGRPSLTQHCCKRQRFCRPCQLHDAGKSNQEAGTWGRTPICCRLLCLGASLPDPRGMCR